MIISNSISDYSPEDAKRFVSVVQQMNEYLTQVNKIFQQESASPSKPTDNLIYINPKVKTEFIQLETKSLPLHEVLAIYYEWHEELLVMATKNIGHYKVYKLQQHMDETMAICRTFVATINNVKS